MREKAKRFLETLRSCEHGVEAAALYIDGEMAFEEHFVPSVARNIYSHTKSFTATAAGMAIDEGKLRLDDKVADFFPEYHAVITDERMKTVTLRDLLTMSSGIGKQLLMGSSRQAGEGCPDYVAYFLSQPIADTPGTKFTYSNGDSHMIGWMVARATGETLQQYLYRKLFSKLGMGYPTWEADPRGNAFGGSALYLTIDQMMKLGILYLNDGVWDGERLLSSWWVKEAGRTQIATGDDSAWGKGYGYQFWMVGNKKDAFRADGAYGQMTFILPDENAVFATQASEHNDYLGEFIRQLQIAIN